MASTISPKWSAKRPTVCTPAGIHDDHGLVVGCVERVNDMVRVSQAGVRWTSNVKRIAAPPVADFRTPFIRVVRSPVQQKADPTTGLRQRAEVLAACHQAAGRHPLPSRRRFVERGQPLPERVQGSLRAARELQFPQNCADMASHRRLTDHERVGDLLVAHALSD